MPRLRRVDPRSAGITRRRKGRGFEYVDPRGRPIRDAEVLERISALALPPAWKDVWICADAMGHIQAVGTDAAGRRQYRYHDHWRERRDRAKHDRVLELAVVLPDLRDQVGKDLADAGRAGISQRAALALAVRLLDLGFFRIGEERYVAANGTFGLTTLQRDHVRVVRSETITFDYLAKGSKRRTLQLTDPEAAAVVSRLKRRRDRSRRLLACTSDGRWCRITSRDVNDYLREATGLAVTAKDFRTWHATVLMAVALAMSTEATTSQSARQRAVARAVAEVAHYLGNTPAVSRRSYIDPRVIDRFNDGQTIRPVMDKLAFGIDPSEPATRGAIEDAVLDLLRSA
jgi:DNA topoisomerase IB